MTENTTTLTAEHAEQFLQAVQERVHPAFEFASSYTTEQGHRVVGVTEEGQEYIRVRAYFWADIQYAPGISDANIDEVVANEIEATIPDLRKFMGLGAESAPSGELADEEMLDRQGREALARFTSPNFAVKDARGEGAEALRKHFYRAALAILLASGPTKSRAVALTELETAMMWAVKAYYGAPGEGDGA